MNVISEDVSLRLCPLAPTMLGQLHEVESALGLVLIGTWSLMLFLSVEDLSDISLLRLLVQRQVDLAVDFVEHGAGVGHRILWCSTFELRL